jgi:hypothetical protein
MFTGRNSEFGIVNSESPEKDHSGSMNEQRENDLKRALNKYALILIGSLCAVVLIGPIIEALEPNHPLYSLALLLAQVTGAIVASLRLKNWLQEKGIPHTEFLGKLYTQPFWKLVRWGMLLAICGSACQLIGTLVSGYIKH